MGRQTNTFNYSMWKVTQDVEISGISQDCPQLCIQVSSKDTPPCVMMEAAGTFWESKVLPFREDKVTQQRNTFSAKTMCQVTAFRPGAPVQSVLYPGKPV